MDVQQIITLLIVAFAIVYLGGRLWRQATNKSGDPCDGCGSCGKPSPSTAIRPAPEAKTLITLGPPPKRRVR